MGNPFWHIELRTNDLAKARQFFKSMFDWQCDESHKDYTTFLTGEEVTGGIVENPASSGMSSHWIPVIEVEDIRTATAKAVQLGAKVIEDTSEQGEWGWSSTIADPTGALLYLFEQKPKK